MALQKTFETDSGASGDYWKIASVVTGFPISGQQSTTLHVDLYISKDLRDAGKPPVFSSDFTFAGQPSADARTWAYDQMKTRPEFVGSVDV